jgi:hypothetical protein
MPDSRFRSKRNRFIEILGYCKLFLSGLVKIK